MAQINPYLIEPPALVSFSGGRTSRYMLKHILDAHGGSLPDDCHVTFFNTGKERPQTLDFVQRTATEYGVRIRWLEFDSTAPGKTREVSHNSAARAGEPFEDCIRNLKGCYLPNPVQSYCSVELKLKRGIVFMRDWCGYKHWNNYVGMRADEAGRVAKQRARNESGKERFDALFPLYHAGVTKRMVSKWSKAQPFDLDLLDVNGKTPEGNCDLCFKKGFATIFGLIRDNPEWADWWIAQEQWAEGSVSNHPEFKGGENAWRFRKDRPAYAEILQLTKDQGDMVCDLEDDTRPCDCHD